ncbi:MAG: Coenzyme F420 hydrogenase/dehydrogenase, beta subunit C-terminal domain [Chloroflexota bacterium]
MNQASIMGNMNNSPAEDQLPTDLSQVIQNHHCIACGACSAVDETVELHLNSTKMIYEPSGPGNTMAAKVCPSIQVDFEMLQQKIFPDESRTPIGVVKTIKLAQSTNRQRNMNASSGGLIKELLVEYLSRDEVDGAIVLAHSNGLTYEPTLITELEEIDRLPGSIYHNVSFAKALTLLKENHGRYVLVAIPCQLEGIYNYIFHAEPDLINRIYVTIGLICGWMYSQHSLKAVSEFKKLDFPNIQDVSYRGGGPVGPLRISFPEEECVINRRRDFDYMVAFDRSFNIPRCHLCINHINFLADIVVGDAWLASTSKTKSGVSIVVCRTDETTNTLAMLEETGRILCADASEAEIVESQGRRFTYGDFAYAYANYLDENSLFYPKMIGPNRSEARLSPAREVAAFHKENSYKVQLQHDEHYQWLWWRKVLIDIKKYAVRGLSKYLNRFLFSGRKTDEASDKVAMFH